MTDDLEDVHDTLERIRGEIAKRIVGQRTVVDHVLACILCDGNALLESNPGLGKTLLVRTIADVTDLAFSRIQNTPDLMPSDIVGTEIIRETGGGQEFQFQRGPVFANIVLADEINRATPKTQSALLEAMQERQVTAAGETHKLPRPFFLLATQNPIDQEGSLHPDESLYMNGSLRTAEDALEYARTDGELAHGTDRTRVYDVDATTQALTPDGELVETGCLVYETDYDGDVYTVETKTGRSIRVSGNHPFLVNRHGVVRWIEARDLDGDDSLASPRRLDLPERPFPTHDEALERIDDEVGEGSAFRRIDDALTPADAGFFVGLLLAEGSVSETAIGVSQRNQPELFDRWVDIAERVGLDVAVRERSTGREAKISSKPFVEYLGERFHLTDPERLLSAPEPFRDEFLETFLLTESHYDAERRRVTFVHTDRTLTNLVAHLLLGVGVVPRIVERNGRYELRIRGEDAERYLSSFDDTDDGIDVDRATDEQRSMADGGLVDGDVFYDPIASIEREPYTGPVIGLSVPDHHNYVAGLGACGINHNTYPLPEAQSDRFLIKILVDYPSFEEERDIVDRYTADLDDEIPVERVVSSDELRELQRLTRQVPIADDLRDEAISIVQRTRNAEDIEFGASPRASMGLVLTSKARALLEGRPHVSREDIETMAPPVLRHRIILDFRAEREGKTPDDVVRDLL